MEDYLVFALTVEVANLAVLNTVHVRRSVPSRFVRRLVQTVLLLACIQTLAVSAGDLVAGVLCAGRGCVRHLGVHLVQFLEDDETVWLLHEHFFDLFLLELFILAGSKVSNECLLLEINT